MSLFSLCCMVLMVICISSSPLARVVGSRARCFSTCKARQLCQHPIPLVALILSTLS